MMPRVAPSPCYTNLLPLRPELTTGHCRVVRMSAPNPPTALVDPFGYITLHTSTPRAHNVRPGLNAFRPPTLRGYFQRRHHPEVFVLWSHVALDFHGVTVVRDVE
jgi:hypothetical protein